MWIYSKTEVPQGVPASRGALSVRLSLSRGVPACGIDLSTATIPWRCTCSSRAFSRGQCFQRQTCSSMALPTATVLSEADLFQHGLPLAAVPLRCSCSVVGLSMATRFEVLQHDLMRSHWCYKVHLLQHGSSTTTDVSKCTFSCRALSLGHKPFRGTPAATQTQPGCRVSHPQGWPL